MKISKSRLKRIIKEELENLRRETDSETRVVPGLDLEVAEEAIDLFCIKINAQNEQDGLGNWKRCDGGDCLDCGEWGWKTIEDFQPRPIPHKPWTVEEVVDALMFYASEE